MYYVYFHMYMHMFMNIFHMYGICICEPVFRSQNSPNRLSKVTHVVGGKPSIQDFDVCHVDPEWPGIKTFSPAVLSSFIRA